MSEEWLSRFNGPPGLKELCVEYETIAWKKAQMDAIVARNKNWKLTLQDGNHLSAADTKLLEWKWAGPSKLGGQSWNHHGDGDTIDYVVVVDRWVWKEGELPEEDKKKRSVDYEEVDDEFGTPPSFHDGNDDHGDEDWDEEDSEDEDSDG